MTTVFTRADLEQSFPNLTPKVRAALEEIPRRLSAAETNGDATFEATMGLANAIVLLLSANDAFPNGQVLTHGAGLVLQQGPNNTVVLSLVNDLTFNGGYRVTFNLLADTNLTLPPTGTVALSAAPGPYADDATAASNGVAIGETYAKPMGALAWRQA